VNAVQNQQSKSWNNGKTAAFPDTTAEEQEDKGVEVGRGMKRYGTLKARKEMSCGETVSRQVGLIAMCDGSATREAHFRPLFSPATFTPSLPGAPFSAMPRQMRRLVAWTFPWMGMSSSGAV
jgi:hypothetical protein